MEYFVLRGHDTEGPLAESDLRRGIAERTLKASDLVRQADWQHWTPLRRILHSEEGSEGVGAPPPKPGGIAGSKSAPVEIFEMISAKPLRAGLVGVALAGWFAYATRWPLILALPGLLLGVGAGLTLLARKRSLVGALIGSSAVALPIAFAPRPSTPATDLKTVGESTPAPVAIAVATPRPVIAQPISVLPAPTPAALAAARPVAAPAESKTKTASISKPAAQQPRPKTAAIEIASAVRPAPTPSVAGVRPPVVGVTPQAPAARPVLPLPADTVPSIGLTAKASATGGKVRSKNGANFTERWDSYSRENLYSESYWSTRDRESRIGIDINVHNFSRFPAVIRVQSLFFSKPKSGGAPQLLNVDVQDFTIPAGDQRNTSALSATVKSSTERRFAQGNDLDSSDPSTFGWAAASGTQGARVYGWVVRVLAGQNIVAMRASTPALGQTARKPDEFSRITGGMSD